MIRTLATLALLALTTPALAADPPALAPSEIVAAAPRADWIAIPASDLLVMDLAPDLKGKPRRVVIQLMPPPFSQGWIGNIRKLAAAHWWDGLSINRVQDNYVVQWGDSSEKKALPPGLAVVPQDQYVAPYADLSIPIIVPLPGESKVVALERTLGTRRPYVRVRNLRFKFGLDSYESFVGHTLTGWPVAHGGADVWPVHCYGMVGVGRDMPPDTGTGAELYTVIGHAPRHLDRNIALVGRVIEGIEHLSSLPRGTGALGFYETAEERVPIRAVRLGNDVKELPRYEYLSTESVSFAAYAEARANRRDPFFIRPAGGADICNIPVPVRRVKP